MTSYLKAVELNERWDELVARKYRAWAHHTALTALVL